MLRICKNLLTLVSLASIGLACRTSAMDRQSPGTVKNHTICVGQIERTFLLFLPENYQSDQASRPLILSYHGGGRTAERQLKLDQLTNPSFNTRAIVVYPQGLSETWFGVPKVETDDIGFTNQLLDTLIKSFRVNPKEIYATGKSQGGGFVGQLACSPVTTERFSAFAAVSGAFYIPTPEDSDDCDPSTINIPCYHGTHPTPFIEFHGGQDDTIPYKGGSRRGACLPSIEHYLKSWAKANARVGLSSPPASVEVPGRKRNLTKDTVVQEWEIGPVRGYFDRRIGHDWPSTLPNADNERQGHEPASFNATSIILDFFLSRNNNLKELLGHQSPIVERFVT